MRIAMFIKKTLETKLYKNLTIEKVEYRNLLLHNISNKLKETTIKEVGTPKFLNGNVLRICKGIVSDIMYRKSNGYSASYSTSKRYDQHKSCLDIMLNAHLIFVKVINISWIKTLSNKLNPLIKIFMLT